MTLEDVEVDRMELLMLVGAELVWEEVLTLVGIELLLDCDDVFD